MRIWTYIVATCLVVGLFMFPFYCMAQDKDIPKDTKVNLDLEKGKITIEETYEVNGVEVKVKDAIPLELTPTPTTTTTESPTPSPSPTPTPTPTVRSEKEKSSPSKEKAGSEMKTNYSKEEQKKDPQPIGRFRGHILDP